MLRLIGSFFVAGAIFSGPFVRCAFADGGPPPPIPTLGQWSMLGLAVLLAIVGVAVLMKARAGRSAASALSRDVN